MNKILISLTDKELKMLKQICKLLKRPESDAVSIALYELRDLLNIYPEVDYREDLGGFLLKEGDKKK